VPGSLDDKVFVIATGQGRIEFGMAMIERNEERPFRITLLPNVMSFAGILVLVVRSSRSKAFFKDDVVLRG
jgi:hypothetical protein